VEALWVPDEFDSIWHELGHNAFMQKCDANNPNDPGNFTQDGILNDFIPDIFTITGVFPRVVRGDLNNLPIVTAFITPNTRTNSRTSPPASLVSPTVKVGQTLLVRLLNAGYATQEYRIGRPGDPVDATVVATDGHAFGLPRSRDQYSSPFVVPAGTSFRLTTARRLDLLLRPRVAGRYPVIIKHFDWVKGRSPSQPNVRLLWGVTRTFINVVA
jgi:hypothetical protein